MIREAEFSIDKKERYSLKREWDNSKNKILYIMLNPSLADDKNDDPTIRRLINFTKKFNYGGFLVGNIFTTITPNPKEIDKSKGISDKNFEKLLKLIKISKEDREKIKNLKQEKRKLKKHEAKLANQAPAEEVKEEAKEEAPAEETPAEEEKK